MAASTEPNSGIKHSWDLGESGWHTENDANLLLLAIAGFHPSVIDRGLTAPPGSPSEGDIYIPAATASGAWAGEEDSLAYYDGAAWVFYTPRTGFSAWIADEDSTAVFKAGSGWSDGVAHAWT